MGLQSDDERDVGSATPLLRRGIGQAIFDGLSGELRGRPLLMAHFNYALAASEGGDPAAFTLSLVENVHTALDGITIHPPHRVGWPWQRPRSTLSDSRHFKTDDGRFDRQYRVEASSRVDDHLLTKLLEEEFRAWALDEQDVFIELEHDVLVVAMPGYLESTDRWADLLARADWVLGRILHADPFADPQRHPRATP